MSVLWLLLSLLLLLGVGVVDVEGVLDLGVRAPNENVERNEEILC